MKSTKVFVRDNGLLPALLSIEDFNELSGHPVVGHSWEGFVLENLLASAPEQAMASFYRTAAGAEVDLLLELPGRHGLWAIEIKRSLALKTDKGFHISCEDFSPNQCFVVYPGSERIPLGPGLQAIGVRELADKLVRL